jgi:hypothetical protein
MKSLLVATAPLQDWHPMVRRLYGYWHELRPGPGLLPGRQHFDPVDVSDLWPDLWMVDRDRGTGQFRYRLVGTGIVRAMGRDVTGWPLDEAHRNEEAYPAYAHCLARLAVGEASWLRGHLWRPADPEIDEGEVLLLPMARDGRSVDMALAIGTFLCAGDIEVRA